jgi:hypothetical protein
MAIAAFILGIIGTCTGCCALWMTVQQFLLSLEKHKLDLFERRYTLFKAIQVYINRAINEDLPLEYLQEFNAQTQTLSFIFGADIVDFMGQVRRKATDLLALRAELGRTPPGDKRREQIAEQQNETHKFLCDALSTLHDRFARYLKFKNWQ